MHFFEPGESDATKTVYYVTYDITNQLISGINFLTITLGNGQYTGYTINPVMVYQDGTKTKFGRYQKNDSCFVKPGICGRKKLIAQVELILKDGTRKIVCTSNEKLAVGSMDRLFFRTGMAERITMPAWQKETYKEKIPSEGKWLGQSKENAVAKGSAYGARVSAKLGSRSALPQRV